MAVIKPYFIGVLDVGKVEYSTSEKGEICTTPRVGDLELANFEEKPFRRN